jgi:hypothetical protein
VEAPLGLRGLHQLRALVVEVKLTMMELTALEVAEAVF